MSVFDPIFEDLPGDLPIFPLTGVLLLPRAQLPLNIFEPRYLNMIADALGEGRMIGMIQPRTPNDESEQPEVYPVGCAGRITQFEETEDGRFMINLRGIARFKLAEELPVDWEKIPEVAEQTFEVFKELTAARKELKAAKKAAAEA